MILAGRVSGGLTVLKLLDTFLLLTLIFILKSHYIALSIVLSLRQVLCIEQILLPFLEPDLSAAFVDQVILEGEGFPPSLLLFDLALHLLDQGLGLGILFHPLPIRGLLVVYPGGELSLVLAQLLIRLELALRH